MQPRYPKVQVVEPVIGPVNAKCRVPGSKSVSNRALVLAALGASRGPCELSGLLHSEDTEVMVESLGKLGWEVEADWANARAKLSLVGKSESNNYAIPFEKADLYVANSGTTMRFLAAMCSLGHGVYRLDGVERMRERPLGDLIEALSLAGAIVECEGRAGCPPVLIRANGWKGHKLLVGGGVSSQFLSGLLLAAPFADLDVEIETTGTLVSEPYIEMTVRMVRDWGGTIEQLSPSKFKIPKQDTFQLAKYDIEPDASAATYFWAIAAITGGEVFVPGLGTGSLQGDVRFVDCLAQMGCQVSHEVDGIRVRGGKLHGIHVDMNAISDTVMTLAAVALFAEGPTRIDRVGHIRHKETDRLRAVANELGRLGAKVEELEDGIVIHPGPLKAARVQTYKDHRMAMSLALVGLRLPGLEIDDPGCVAKTYPWFWRDLDQALRSTNN